MNSLIPPRRRTPFPGWVPLFAAATLAAVLGVTPAAGQAPAPRQQLQAGIGILPGVGLQGGLVLPHGIYTLEGLLYADGSPPFAGGEGSLQLSGGIGGAVRVFGILRALGSPGYARRDLDVGIRFGPSLFFTLGESSRGENPFSLFIDPFARVTSTLGSDRLFFAEIGFQRPLLRAGLLFDL